MTTVSSNIFCLFLTTSLWSFFRHAAWSVTKSMLPTHSLLISTSRWVCRRLLSVSLPRESRPLGRHVASVGLSSSDELLLLGLLTCSRIFPPFSTVGELSLWVHFLCLMFHVLKIIISHMLFNFLVVLGVKGRSLSLHLVNSESISYLEPVTYVHMCIDICVCMNVFIHSSLHIYVSVCMFACVCICTCMCLYGQSYVICYRDLALHNCGVIFNQSL